MGTPAAKLRFASRSGTGREAELRKRAFPSRAWERGIRRCLLREAHPAPCLDAASAPRVSPLLHGAQGRRRAGRTHGHGLLFARIPALLPDRRLRLLDDAVALGARPADPGERRFSGIRRLGTLFLRNHAAGRRGLPSASEPAWANLAAGGELFWVSVVVLFGAGLAWLRGPDRGRVLLLLAASFYFYASWNPYLACLIFVSTILDYFLAHGIERLKAAGGRKALVAVSVTANLGLLCYFKYANFFLASLEAALHRCGAATSIPLLQILAPIGISFYTFEAINYTVDVYRGKVRAERNLANFMLFILFFPHLVAGPIVRAATSCRRSAAASAGTGMRVELGVRFFLMGLFKKLVIADRMALFADPVFHSPTTIGAAATWMAVIAYALQIYCDFSGYTDMAIGTAHMLGYQLAKNFNMPYLSTNVAEFWRRWHISLSSWLRDYLFIPLGGSRGAQLEDVAATC